MKVLEFARSVGVLVVLKYPKTGFSNTFRVIQPLIVHNQWLLFLLQDLNLNLFTFGWVLRVQKLILFLLRPNFNNRTCQIATDFEKSLCSNSNISISTSFMFFTKVKTKKNFLVDFCRTNYQFRSCIGILIFQKCHKSFDDCITSKFRLVFPKNYWLEKLFLGLNLKHSTCWWIFI